MLNLSRQAISTAPIDEVALPAITRRNCTPRTNGPTFSRLEGYVRRLRLLLAVIMGCITVLPAIIYSSIQVGHRHDTAQEYANQIAALVNSRHEKMDLNLRESSSQLWQDMKNHLVSIRFLGERDVEILRLGEPMHGVFAVTAEAQLNPPVQGIKSVTVQMPTRPLLLVVGRVFVIHLVAALVLALVVYALPMRALQRAITDVKNAQAQVIHSDKLSAIGEVYANLAHEINSPLSIALSRVKLLLHSARKGQVQQDLTHDLEVIERQGSRIGEILQGLLTFARKGPVGFERTELNLVIKEAVSLVERSFANAGVRIQRDLSPGLPLISGNPNQLQQVFVNLLNNARDAMPNGGQINVRNFKNNGYLVAEVQDSGSGIPQDIQGKIFEPFFTTKEAGKGTGLGLAVTYGIIMDHSGDVSVDSVPGKGSVFRIRLPIADDGP